MINFLKKLKIIYMAYNFFHKSELIHNEILYKKIGLKKKYYSPISSKDFKAVKKFYPFSLNSASIQKRLLSTASFNNLSDTEKNSLLDFAKKGFAILKNYLNAEEVGKINSEIDFLIDNKRVKFLRNNKIMFAHKKSKLLEELGNQKKLIELLSALLGSRAILFQSINFLMGSEQATHSDSIHMTTYPEGVLLGVWIALEDITEENGPLHYYPGSHTLPYYMNQDYQNEGNKWLLGNKSYREYEKMIDEKIKEHKMKKEIFYAKKGDVIIWHANLFHGGEPHVNKSKTRKSMVFHYFGEEAICYHEITQRPALLKYN